MKPKGYWKEYYAKNREKRLECVKQCYIRNPENKKKYQKQYYIKNRERLLEQSKQYNKKYKKKNANNIREYHRIYKKERRKTDLKYNLNRKVSYSVYKSLKRNKAGRKWEILIGYTLNKLIKHLKSTIPEGYIWQDYLKGKLHIDHIIPMKAFVFTKPEDREFKQCWSLCNLRLLPAHKNLQKNSNFDNPILLGLLLRSMINKC